MARPGPQVICEHNENDRTVQICVADAVYAVVYQGQAIKLRTLNQSQRYQGYKYGKTSFPEPGHAIRLARDLNLTYNTQDFAVAVMTPARIVPI